MARLVSPRLSGNPLARLAVSGLRFAGRTALGERIAGHWYRERSRAVAAELVRLPGVESVYLSGSTRERVVLGYSDVDLVLATELATVTDELRLRDALVRCLRKYNRPIELFLHIDYVEARDLSLLRQLGNAWSIALDGRSELLAGRDHRRPMERPRPFHAAVASFAASVGHWINQSCLLLEKPSMRDAFAVWRIAERLLRGVLSAWLGRVPDEPLERLLEEAAPKLGSDAAKRLTKDPPDEKTRDGVIRNFVTVTLEALDAQAREFSRELDGAWPAINPAPRIDWPSSGDLTRAALELGFEDLEAAPRGVGGAKHVLFMTAPETLPPGDAVDRYVALLGRIAPLPRSLFGKATWPVLLTPALRRAAAFIEPFPLVGAALASGAAWSSRRALVPPPAPRRAVFDVLATSAQVQLLWRPRGRALRLTRGRGDTYESMAYEILGATPQLLSAAAGEAIDLSEPRFPPGAFDERFLIERLRELQEAVRPGLRALLLPVETG